MFTEAFLDTRFAALPRLVRSATNPSITIADVRVFMDDLLQADPALFDCALQFLSRAGHGFVLVRQSGGPTPDTRSWPRWPLKRLFATRRASLITNPISGQRALAMPFSIRTERHVVIAPLSLETFDATRQAFLDVLQSACVPARTATLADERVPRFMWLGTNALLVERIAALLKRRGWPLLSAPTFAHALLMLEQDRADVVLLDARSLNSELPALRAVRHAAKIGDAPIVYFVDTPSGAEVQTLVDCILSPDAAEGELLRALKTSAAQVSRTRSNALHASVERIERELRTCNDFPELAQTCAEAALLLGADAVSVMLADPVGGVHAAHVPFQTVLGDHWPTPFLTGETISQTRVEDTFFEQAFDDVDYANRVRRLHAVSAAALPIANGPHIVGSLLAFSLRLPMFQPEFDAFADLCERTGRIASMLLEPRMHGKPWERAVAGDAIVEAFEGRHARSSIYVRGEQDRIAVVMLEPQDERRARAIAERLLGERRPDLREFVRSCKEDAHGILLGVVEDGVRLHFACEGVPFPLRVPLSGPVPSTRFAASCESGAIQLDAQSLTLMYGGEFASQIATADLVGAVQRGLRFSRATLARSIPGLGTSAQKLAFVCITMLSSDVDLPHRPALL